MGIIGTNQISYKFCDTWTGELLAELPVNGVTMSLGLNQAGSWSGTLQVEDPNVQAAGWRYATIPYQTDMWLDINGTLIGGGPVLGRKYTMSQQQVAINGAEPGCYLNQLIQNGDYSAYTNPATGNAWATAGASVLEMAYTITDQALGQAGTLPITLITNPPIADVSSEFFVTGTFPSSQAQTIQSILTQFTGMAYMVSCDWTATPAYVAGLPTKQITFSYPRAGTPAAESIVVIDIASALEMEYDEDATSMSNSITEMLGSSGGVSLPINDESSLQAGWPLTQQVVSHASFSPTEESDNVLNQFGYSDLGLYAFPTTVMTVTLPLFNSALPIGSFNIGQDVLVRVYKAAGAQPATNPRFPDGLSFWFRIVQCDITIPDYGVPTMALTLNLPLSEWPTIPQPPYP